MEKTSYVDLPAIIIGTAVALAITIILLHFGSMLGLALAPDAEWNPETAFGQIITICLWGLWVQILASLIGGYIAGRMRTPVAGSSAHEREMRDGVHGLSVWAFATVLTAIGAALLVALATLTPDGAAEVSRAAEIMELNESAAVVSGFSTAAVSLVSAVASWFAATKGGEHRDEGADLSRYVSFRK
ncbi:MAG: hypothetical protein WBK55_04465 [Alphaproteobacteria bacterium]